MKIALINGSPKSKNSVSGDLLSDLQACFTSDIVFGEFPFHKPEISEAIVSELSSFDVWVFGFPLYVDGIPSQLLYCLCQIEKVGVGGGRRNWEIVYILFEGEKKIFLLILPLEKRI